jgi:beta-galactosidase
MPETAKPLAYYDHEFFGRFPGLTSSDQQLPSVVRVRHGTNSIGRRMHYYLNYSGAPQTFKYAYGAGTDTNV